MGTNPQGERDLQPHTWGRKVMERHREYPVTRGRDCREHPEALATPGSERKFWNTSSPRAFRKSTSKLLISHLKEGE